MGPHRLREGGKYRVTGRLGTGQSGKPAREALLQKVGFRLGTREIGGARGVRHGHDQLIHGGGPARAAVRSGRASAAGIGECPDRRRVRGDDTIGNCRGVNVVPGLVMAGRVEGQE
jgi:hypothetical protein